MGNGIIFGNSILDVVFAAWFIAQFYKVITTLVIDRKINLKRFLETGGMPSSHSSTVSALTASVGIVHGVASTFFAVSIVFAIIVMYDAAGIRRSAGEQASVINSLRDTLNNILDKHFGDVHLKELLGHTPIEVLIGSLVGIAVAFVFKFHLIA